MSEHHHHHSRHRDEASLFKERSLRGIKRCKLLERILKYSLMALAVVMAVLVFLAYSIG